MNFYLLDTSLKYIRIIESYSSMIWAQRYFEAGDFELHMPVSADVLHDFQRNYYIVRDDDLTQAMIIENIQITTDVEAGDYITITGKSLKSILNRRIIWTQTVVRGNLETAIRSLITQNVISPVIAARAIDNVILGDTIGLTDSINSQFTGDNLGETLTILGRTYGIGYDLKLDIANKNFIFVLIKGEDRTYQQNVNPRVVFSNTYENLLTTDYTLNSDEYKNVALVAGEGEGTARKTATIGTASGLNRYELFVDARDISSNDGEIQPADYNDLLVSRGMEDLSQCEIVEDINGEVETHSLYKPNIDYFVGDIVEIINMYGISMTPRIIELIECVDENGYTCIPTFSTNDQIE